MKPIFTGLILLLTANCGWAQMGTQPRITIIDSDSSFFKKNPSFLGNFRQLRSDSMRFSHSTSAGTVYTLPKDGMPCFVPSTSFVYNMPTKNVLPNSNIPNGYQLKPSAWVPLFRKQP